MGSSEVGGGVGGVVVIVVRNEHGVSSSIPSHSANSLWKGMNGTIFLLDMNKL